MRTLVFVLGLLVLLFFPTLLLAQNPNATPASQVTWEQPAGTMAEAQGYTYRAILDGGTPTILPNHKCGTGPSATEWTCSAPMPTMGPGPHSLSLTASNLAGSSLPSTPLSFVFVVIPQPPRNLRIVNP